MLYSDRVFDAISAFESYQNSLTLLKPGRIDKDKIRNEFILSRDDFLNRLHEKANIYINNADWSNASLAYSYLFKFNNENADIVKNYIKCLNELKQYDLALDLLDYFSEIHSNDISIYKLYAEIYSSKKDNIKAVECYEKYLSEKDKDTITADEYNQLGCYYDVLSRRIEPHKYIKKSLDCFKKALELRPYNKLFNKNIAIVGLRYNDLNLIKTHWDNIIRYNLMNNDDKYDYALFCQKIFNIDGLKKYYDSRFYKETGKVNYPQMGKPVWLGEDISEKTLLIYAEQGFGDNLLMSGYIQRVNKKCKKVIYLVQSELYRLMKYSLQGIEIFPRDSVSIKNLDFDYHIPIMSLPLALNLNRDNISVGGGYLKVDNKTAEGFNNKYFNNDKLKIGISFWSNNVLVYPDRDLFDEYLPLLDKIKNAEFYLLNKYIDMEKFSSLKENKVINIADDCRDFYDTAAAAVNCDIILTTDNGILNLAGALGKKTYALFNWHNEYRWFDLTGDDVVFYTSVKPFVNKEINAWDTSLNRAIEEINQLKNNC